MTPEEKAKKLALAKAKLRLLQLQEAEAPDAAPVDAAGIEPDSPLAQALAANPEAETVTIDTPTGPIELDREGNEVKGLGQRLAEHLTRTREKRLGEGAATLSGTTGGQFAPQLIGANAAGGELLRRLVGGGSGRELGDVYRQRRDETAQAVEGAVQKHSPEVLGVSVLPVLGGVASMGPLAETVPARLGLASALAALRGAATSRADLTRGEVAPFAQDVALQGAVGLGAAGLGEGIGVPLRALSRAAGRGADKALAQGTAKAGKPMDKALANLEEGLASAAGRVGGETQKGSRILENIQRGTGGTAPTGVGPAAVGPEAQRKALLALTSPEARELAEGVLESSREALPGQLQRVAAAKAQSEALGASAQPLRKAFEARRGELVEDYFAHPFRPLATFARSQVPRQATGLAVGGGLYGLGEATENDWLKLAGAGAYGSIAGAPGYYRALQNLVKAPAARLPVMRGLEAATGAPAAAMSRAAGGAGQSPELRAILAALLGQQSGTPEAP